MRAYLLIIIFLSSIVSSCKKGEPIPEPPNSKFTLEYLGNGKVKTNIDGIVNTANIYTWTFGDGNSYSGYDATHTYKQNGTYSITLVTSSKDGQSSTTKTALIDNIATTGQSIIYLAKYVPGYVKVNINGVYQGQITHYYTNTIPNCGEAGSVTITRPAGVYNITATGDNNASWSGTTTITNGMCNKLGLN